MNTIGEIIKNKDLETYKKLEEMSKIYGQSKEDLKKNEAFMEYITKNLAQEAVIGFIVQNAKVK